MLSTFQAASAFSSWIASHTCVQRAGLRNMQAHLHQWLRLLNSVSGCAPRHHQARRHSIMGQDDALPICLHGFTICDFCILGNSWTISCHSNS